MKRPGWNRKVGIMVLFACLLATFVACGGEKQKETSVVSDSGSSSHSSESPVASSSEADSSTTESVPMGTSIDKSEYIMNLFGGRVLGNKGSGLVYDLDTDIHAVGQKIFDELKIPVNLKQDFVFPQLTFDTEDAKNFNEFIKMLSNDILGNWEEGQNTYFESIKDDILQNGFGYLKYGVVESEKFLSVIIVHAYTYEDYRRPDYTMSAYVFEKDTGRYVSARELIDMAKAENQDRLYAGLADVFGRFIVDYTSVNQSLAARYATYLYALWDSVQHSAPGFELNPMSFALGSISDAVLYVDESGIPRIAIPYNDYFFYDSGGRFEAAKKDLEKYTWYNETVVDIPLADLKEEEIRESELYRKVREKYGIESSPDVLIAYIGVADDITVSAYQKFVDDFKVSYTPYDLVMQLNYDYENYSPRSVYLVIPKYENAVAHLTYGFDRGFCVMTVDQNENNLHPITILYGEKETEIQIPVDYKVGEFKIEQEGVVDFTEHLNLEYNPSVQIREEIEEFFSMVRTRG